MGKAFIVKKQEPHKHHWVIDGICEGAGIMAQAKCKTCGAETTFVNYIDWTSLTTKKPAEVETDEVDVLLEEDSK